MNVSTLRKIHGTERFPRLGIRHPIALWSSLEEWKTWRRNEAARRRHQVMVREERRIGLFAGACSDLGLEAEELAQLLGVTADDIAPFCTGRRIIPGRVLNRIIRLAADARKAAA